MLRDGPIPRFAHGAIEYVAGVVFIVAPFALGFDSGAATAVSIVVGVIVLVVAASTEGPTSLSNALQVQLHILLDFALAAFLIASPFLFGYSDETAPTAFFIAMGVLHLLLTIGTRFKPRERRR
jgi:VIT1/CCC1 family predicted Fe2+/Mn2+ transporter